MHVTLLVPDLFWPRDDGGDPYRELQLPALALLLSRARRGQFPALTPEAWLCQAFEVERQQDWPVAPITLSLDGCDPGDDYWLRADPVHLMAHRDHLTLLGGGVLRPHVEEAAELVAALNGYFAADQLRFQAPHSERWYLRAPGTPRLETRELSGMLGRDIGAALPEGADAVRWRRVLNEAQMLLHGHPVNERREARGELPINSVWLWGGGRRTRVAGRHFTHLIAGNALALALAAHADAHVPQDGRLPRHDATARVLIVAEEPGAAYGDDGAWRAFLTETEQRWARPLLEALRRREVTGLALVALHPRACQRYELHAADLLRFWRTVKPLSSFAPAPDG